jgi:DNA polymerase-3 subunit beta
LAGIVAAKPVIYFAEAKGTVEGNRDFFLMMKKSCRAKRNCDMKKLLADNQIKGGLVMKLVCDKKDFLPAWEMCEKCAGDSKLGNIFSTVLFTADEEGLKMKSTDLKTAVFCRVAGIDVQEPGETAIQTKRVNELFHKAGDNFTLVEKDEKVAITSGRSRSKFTAHSARSFPKLPESSAAKPFCTVKAPDLSKALRAGGVYASAKDEFPQYLSAVYLDLSDIDLTVVSTDRKCLAAARITHGTAGEEQSALLPMKAVNNLAGILDKFETDVEIKHDSSQVFFIAPNMEFSIRKTEYKFPKWKTILPSDSKTKLKFAAADLLEALERVNIVVRDYNRMVLFDISENECVCSGIAQEFGEAREVVPAEISGEVPVQVRFNVKYVISALRAIGDDFATLELHGVNGHGVIRSAAKPDEFTGLISSIEAAGGERESQEVSEP